MDTNNDWHNSPLEAFKEFVQTTAFVKTHQRINRARIDPIADRSALTYILMFGKFTRWMNSKQKTLFTLMPEELLEFLELGDKNKPDLNSKIAYRYLRLIERCYTHLRIQPNPAQHAIFNAIRPKMYKDKDMIALSNDEFLRFFQALPTHSTKHPSNQPFSGWKRRRDRAVQLVMLCAGLRVSEVISLRVDALDKHAATLDGSIKLRITTKSKQNISYEHTTYLQGVAKSEVLAWFDERQKMNIPGELLFPTNLDGKSIDKATVYRQVQATFKRAGIDLIRSGGRTLRNTFAVQALKNGTADQKLMEHLGLVLERSVQTYAIAGSKIK